MPRAHLRKRSQPKPPERKEVSIKKVNNGFVVSSFTGDFTKEKSFIAKTRQEAKNLATKML